MRILLAAVLTSALLLTGCNKGGQAAKDDKKGSEGNPINAPLDYLAAEAAAKKTSERVANTAPIIQAIQQFRAGEDRYPRDLNELLKAGYIGRIPEAPAGQGYWINPQTGELKVVPLSALSAAAQQNAQTAGGKPGMAPASTIHGFKQRLPPPTQVPNE